MNLINISFMIIIIWTCVTAKKYYVFNLSKVNWYTAFEECASRNMQMASIHSEAEQADIEKVIREADLAPIWYWISGINLGDTGKYVWMSTGKPIKYTFWASGQPNGGGEHCLMIRLIRTGNITSTHWVDWVCGEKAPFICEDKPHDNGHQCQMPINLTVVCK